MDKKRLFIDKYKPGKLNEVISNELATARLKSFVLRNPGGRGLLLHGPSGSGKTCSVYALALELGFEVVEVNASDYRNKENISSIVRGASEQRSLFSSDKLVLIDEVDNISGTKDRGGMQAHKHYMFSHSH